MIPVATPRSIMADLSCGVFAQLQNNEFRAYFRVMLVNPSSAPPDVGGDAVIQQSTVRSTPSLVIVSLLPAHASKPVTFPRTPNSTLRRSYALALHIVRNHPSSVSEHPP